MALSGIYRNWFHGSSSGGYCVGIEWTVNSQSKTTNSSSVTATTFIQSAGSGYSISSTASKNISLTINGSAGSSTNTVGIGTNTRKDLYTRTITVNHNADGTKSCAFSSTVGVAVTLSGTYYGNVTVSGTGTFNTIDLNSPPVWVSGGYITIKDQNNNVLTAASGGTENAVKFGENISTLNLSWHGATDPDKDIVTYDLYEQVDGAGWTYITSTTNTSYSRGIGSGPSTQGKTYDYYIRAKDPSGEYASGNQDATQVQKNSFTAATVSLSGASPTYGSSSFTIVYSGGSNTASSGTLSYSLSCPVAGVTVYNPAGGLLATPTTAILIWRTGDATPASNQPYVKFDEIKAALSGSDYKGNIRFILTTANNFGTSGTDYVDVYFDLRTALTTTGFTFGSISGGKTVNSIVYLMPSEGSLTFTWGAAQDKLGGAVVYDLYYKYSNQSSYTTITTGVTGNSYTYKFPNIASSVTLTIQVIARATYGSPGTATLTSPATQMYYWANPIATATVSRNSGDYAINGSITTNTNIPNINLSVAQYSINGAARVNATIATKSFSMSKTLAQGSSETVVFYLKDKAQADLAKTEISYTVPVPKYYPILSVREKGVGVNIINASDTYILDVNGASIFRDTINLVSTPTGFTANTKGGIFGADATSTSGIIFSAASGSNDPGAIYHETSSVAASTNRGVLHLCPSDDADNANDYVSIHGTNDPENIKLYTGGNGWFAGEVNTAKLTGRGASVAWTSIDVGGNKGGYTGFNFTDNDYAFMVRSSDGLNGVYNTTAGAWKYQFDGTGKLVVVNGISSQGAIGSSGEFISTSPNSFRSICGSYGFFVRNDGSNTYFMLTNANDQYGSWNSLRPIMINNANGAVTLGNGAATSNITLGSITKSSGSADIVMETGTNGSTGGVQISGQYINGRLWGGTGGFVVDSENGSLHLRSKGSEGIVISDNDVSIKKSLRSNGMSTEANSIAGFQMYMADSTRGTIRPNSSDGSCYLGLSAARWFTIFSVNALSTSDSKFKEDIEIINREATTFSLRNENPDEATPEETYEFMRDMPLYRFKYREMTDGAAQNGFMADEIAGHKVADRFVYSTEGGYYTSTQSYAATIHIALQETMKKNEQQAQEISDLRNEVQELRELVQSMINATQ